MSTVEEIEQHIASVPEPGMTVEVRRRIWVVSDVTASGTVTRPDGRQGDHLVSLISVEDDGIGDELQVIWEIEPGTRIIERAGLPKPTGFDPPERLRAFLDAVRWGAVATSDREYLQAPFRSGIVVEDYQLDPVVRAQRMPRVNLLIGDDVGLGKTIEAGLVVQELMIRQRARTVLIISPASLQLKWKDEMREKFGLEFRIVDTNYVRWLRRNQGLAANPWTSFPRLITSMDWVKHRIPRRTLEDALPPVAGFPRTFDMMIVDEAHNVAPAGTGNYALDTLRSKVVQWLAPHFEHHLFLTATPHNGYVNSFTSLLETLDPQRFARGVYPDKEQLRSTMVRRLKSEIVDADGKPVFPSRDLHRLDIRYTEGERELHEALQAYTKARQSAGDGGAYEAAGLLGKLLKKRLYSCPTAFSRTLAAHMRGLEADKDPRRRVSRRDIERIDRGLRDDRDDDEEIEDEFEAGVTVASAALGRDEAASKQMLAELKRLAEREEQGTDSKARALMRWLEQYIKPEGEWSDERVIIFTEYLATLRWLYDILASHGYGGQDRLLTMYGGMDSDKREMVKAAFQAPPDVSNVRLLLATDTASEGIDLQKYCNKLIHYDIPWNPNVMEQRNGRVDRHGQKRDTVQIWHPVAASVDAVSGEPDPGSLEGDLEFLYRVARKVDAIREDLGKVGPVLEEQVEEAMLGFRRTIDTEKSEKEAASARHLLTFERRLREQVQRQRERLDRTRSELHLEPERIQDTVRIALDLSDQPRLEETSLAGAPPGTVYEMPALRGEWESCLDGLADPYTQQRRPVTFHPEVARGRDGVVLIHLEHRLVRLALQKLRAEVWTADDVKNLHRFSCRRMTGSYPFPVVVAWARLVVTGGRGHRLHEEVIATALDLSGTRPRRLNVTETDEILRSASETQASEEIQKKMLAQWDQLAEPVMRAIDARSRDRHEYVLRAIDRRREQEREGIASTLHELERTIREELTRTVQLELFAEDERRQVQGDRASLEDRLGQIPKEIEKEQDLVDERFRNPEPRPFPIAVEFLVPSQWRG